jgi:hypothetical protein
LAALVVVRAHSLPGPPPSDDVLYFDAAARLVRGEYQPPSASWPFHHYIRWPVVLPLALLYRLFGHGDPAIAAFSALHLIAIGLLSYALVVRLSRDASLALAGGFAVLLMPSDILPPWHSVLVVRSELPSLAWSMGVFVTIACGRADRKPPLFLAGILLAVAVAATQVTIFSVPAALVLIRSRLTAAGRRDLPALVVAVAVFFAGFAALTGATMAVEGVLFGDPLIQARAVGWWQLLPTRLEDRLAAYVDPGNAGRFVFGFTLRIIRETPIVAALIGFAVASAIGPGRGRGDPARTLVAMACASFVTLELASPFVVEKIYFRFVTVPGHLFCLAVVVELVRRLRAIRGFASALAPIGAASLIVLHLAGEWRASHFQPRFRYYHDPIELIANDLRETGSNPSAANVFFEAPGVPGLILWGLAVSVYGNYAFVPERIRVGRPSPGAEGRTYWVQQDPAAQPPLGLQELLYPTAAEEERPRVFRSPPPLPSAAATLTESVPTSIFGPNRATEANDGKAAE